MSDNLIVAFEAFMQLNTAIETSTALAKNGFMVIGRYRDTPQDIKDISAEVSHLVNDLQTLKGFIESHNDASRAGQLNQLRDTLKTCWGLIGRINKLLGLDSSSQQSGRDSFFQDIEAGQQHQEPEPVWRDKLKWVAVKGEALELLQQLKTQRQNIIMFLQIGLAQGVRAIQIDVDTTSKNVEVVMAQMNETEMRDFRRWWTTIYDEIRAMHLDKRGNQEPNTCKWILSEPNWVTWLQGTTEISTTVLISSRFSWIWGIPGSGKTVMASFLNDQVANIKGQRLCAYYYCLHSRGKDETEDFLRCVIKTFQKNAEYIPENLRLRFDEDVRPREDDLLESLVRLAEKLGRIYIIVDAIDESRDRGHIARVLHKLGTCRSFWRISLLVTSRNETDIREIFTQAPQCVEIPMSGAGVKDDMRRLARSELGKIQGWSEQTTARVESALVDRAQGMFRWLVCQLDLVKRLGHEFICDESYVLREIRNFPEDLFGTYERILAQIKDSDRDFARTALALLCNPRTPITSAEILVEASLYKIEFGNIGGYDVDRLKNVCSCLVNVTRRKHTRPTGKFNYPDGQLVFRAALAHYTVKEYLLSRHAAEGKARFFALSDDFLRIVDLLVFFRGLQRFGIRNWEQKRKNHVHPYDETALAVTEHALSNRRSELMDNAELLELVLSSLKPTSQHGAYLKQQGGIRGTMRQNFPQWDKLLFGVEVRPLGQNADHVGVLLNLMLLGWPELAKKYLENPDIKNLSRAKRDAIWTEPFKIQGEGYETLLGYVIRTRNGSFLDLFTRNGAFFDLESEVLFSPLQNLWVIGDDSDRTFTLLKEVLKHGADPNPKPTRNGLLGPGSEEQPLPKKFAFTPLQVAVAHLEPDWVEALLDAGADACDCGIEGGHVPRAFNDYINGNADLGGELLGLGLKKPLEICERTQPPWASDVNKNQVNAARREVRLALGRWMKKGSDETPETPLEGGTMGNPHVVS